MRIRPWRDGSRTPAARNQPVMSQFECPMGDEDCPLRSGSQPAVHVTDLVEGKVAKIQHYCRRCAEKFNLVQPKTPIKISAEVLEDLLAASGAEDQPGSRPRATGRSDELCCPGCDLTLSDFKARGRLGCPRCYDVFQEVLLPVLERVHDSIQHVGDHPSLEGRDLARADQLAEVQRQLRDAVEQEDYERAAVLRDQVLRLEKGQKLSGSTAPEVLEEDPDEDIDLR